MLSRPKELGDELIAATLWRSWGITPAKVTYAAVGHGSFNWVVVADDGGKWFVKVDPASSSDFFGVTQRTAVDARDRGCPFLNVTIPDQSGALRVRVGEDWELSVVDFIDGHNPDFLGTERALVAEVIGRLHGLAAVPAIAFEWTPGYRHPELRDLLDSGLGRRWDSGPYAAAAFELVTASTYGIEMLFARVEHWYEQLLNDDARWVLTHGEPHGGNSLIDAHGVAHLIDCNAMMIAPPERDLRLLLYGDHRVDLGLDNADVLAAYRRGGGTVAAREHVLELFRADWHLSEISAYAIEFAGPHGDDPDTASHWRWLRYYLPVEQNWP